MAGRTVGPHRVIPFPPELTVDTLRWARKRLHVPAVGMVPASRSHRAIMRLRRLPRPPPRLPLFALAALLFAPVRGSAQAEREWITEATVTFGRHGETVTGDPLITRVLALADLGLRWRYTSGRSLGVSLAGGYDVPNEAAVGGVRGRLGLDLGPGHAEASLGVFASSVSTGSVGAVLGLAYYPVPWGAAVLQLDLLPALEPEVYYDPDDPFGPAARGVEHGPWVSAGLRLGERPGLVTWGVAGVLGILAATVAATW
jgi:hypothetical protein